MLSDERDAIATELDPPFAIENRDGLATPYVFCSPHSGRTYPRKFLEQSQLDPITLRRSEDCFVDDLFLPAASLLHAPLIAARFPRAFLDVNREPFELDARLFNEPLPEFANQHTTRVAGGLGTIARIVADGAEIYKDQIPLAVALQRIKHLYQPFHEALADLLTARQRHFGYAVLLDCHSMPSSSMTPTASERADIVLGDRFGVSCDSLLSARLKQGLEDMGYSVRMNRPYAGGYITERHGRPAHGYHAIQIEINRGLYMNEETFMPTLGFSRLRRDLKHLAQQMSQNAFDLSVRPTAAE